MNELNVLLSALRSNAVSILRNLILLYGENGRIGSFPGSPALIIENAADGKLDAVISEAALDGEDVVFTGHDANGTITVSSRELDILYLCSFTDRMKAALRNRTATDKTCYGAAVTQLRSRIAEDIRAFVSAQPQQSVDLVDTEDPQNDAGLPEVYVGEPEDGCYPQVTRVYVELGTVHIDTDGATFNRTYTPKSHALSTDDLAHIHDVLVKVVAFRAGKP